MYDITWEFSELSLYINAKNRETGCVYENQMRLSDDIFDVLPPVYKVSFMKKQLENRLYKCVPEPGETFLDLDICVRLIFESNFGDIPVEIIIQLDYDKEKYQVDSKTTRVSALSKEVDKMRKIIIEQRSCMTKMTKQIKELMRFKKDQVGDVGVFTIEYPSWDTFEELKNLPQWELFNELPGQIIKHFHTHPDHPTLMIFNHYEFPDVKDIDGKSDLSNILAGMAMPYGFILADRARPKLTARMFDKSDLTARIWAILAPGWYYFDPNFNYGANNSLKNRFGSNKRFVFTQDDRSGKYNFTLDYRVQGFLETCFLGFLVKNIDTIFKRTYSMNIDVSDKRVKMIIKSEPRIISPNHEIIGTISQPDNQKPAKYIDVANWHKSAYNIDYNINGIKFRLIKS